MAKIKQVAQGATTNEQVNSLVKVVVKEHQGKWKSPKENEVFKITEGCDFPDILFELDMPGSTSCMWSWEINWAAATSGLRESTKRGRTLKKWSASGKIPQSSFCWKADLDGKCLGGLLTVTAIVDGKKFKRKVRIVGTNPSEKSVLDYIATFDNVPNFDKLVRKESKFKQFINADEEPVVAFDGGYGLTQLTNPPPKYNEAWSWKDNMKAGVDLYRVKMSEAKNFLQGGKNGKRKFTQEQLELETWCRWNSGTYHKWDEVNNKWVRKPNILGDSETSNIGWDMTDNANTGKSEKTLHDRDKDEYSKPPSTRSHWKYSGVIYADHVKDN
jgi:hypothetical protein